MKSFLDYKNRLKIFVFQKRKILMTISRHCFVEKYSKGAFV
jgi:hypothetical protein